MTTTAKSTEPDKPMRRKTLMSDVTQLFEQMRPDEEGAMDRILPVVYEQLRQLARGKLFHEGQDGTLQTTALVHEAYLRLVGTNQHWDGKGHFFAAAGEAMRRILVDRARARQRVKRGGKMERHALDEVVAHFEPPSEDVLALHEHLDLFADKFPAKADLVKLRYFAGFTTVEAAMALEITPRTAERYWAFARAWLFREMKK
jgi:RNA polymerase sigma factor (TIGR02999 family)